MDFWLHITTLGLGHDEGNGDRVLSGFEDSQADLGPVVSQNLSTGALYVTIALNAPTIEQAISEGFSAFKRGMGIAGFGSARVDAVTVVPVSET